MTDQHDDAPDIPPTGGFHDRRESERRQEDAISRDMETWVARLFIHRGKLVALASAITFTFTSLGFRVLGPTQEIKGLDQKFTTRDSLMNLRVSRLEDNQGRMQVQLDAIQTQLVFVAYLQCVQMKRSDPNSIVDGCPTTRR
jgi:hypothetical protein